MMPKICGGPSNGKYLTSFTVKFQLTGLAAEKETLVERLRIDLRQFDNQNRKIFCSEFEPCLFTNFNLM